MKATDFCSNMDLSILQFIFSITDEIQQKIEKKKLFYKEQIIRYVNKKIDFFFRAFNLTTAVLHTYKYEAYNTIMFKLKNILKENNIFQCV